MKLRNANALIERCNTAARNFATPEDKALAWNINANDPSPDYTGIALELAPSGPVALCPSPERAKLPPDPIPPTVILVELYDGLGSRMTPFADLLKQHTNVDLHITSDLRHSPELVAQDC